ncbi:hypothetical protein [Acaryochloris marina]|uniref:Uncharacterized protein n=1 Tax=Acaryochloris marina (strain MBIC 11017) TaxID=329726 RepID=B0C0W1_ACAM1|nr:hypothetical protein [Acaryochloris marina]ABW27220.1 hypothetical protein AM1_2207 [Acaryochloris marina MBIC11017]BDM81971.1 hypothetical protein AM10699_48350 [Acaryochloris marina MBIC10699]
MSIVGENSDIQARISWFTIQSTDLQAVAEVLGLDHVRSEKWQETIQPEANTRVYVAQDNWVIVEIYDWDYNPANEADMSEDIDEGCAVAVEALLVKLSQQFGEAQFFEFDTEEWCGPTSWMLARNGQIIRSFVYSPEFPPSWRNMGEPTATESFIDWSRVQELESWSEEDWDEWGEHEAENEASNLVTGWQGMGPASVETIKIAREWSVDPLTPVDLSAVCLLGTGRF